jgi:hypothetical protein
LLSAFLNADDVGGNGEGVGDVDDGEKSWGVVVVLMFLELVTMILKVVLMIDVLVLSVLTEVL